MDLQKIKDKMLKDSALLQKTMARIVKNRDKLLKSGNVMNVWDFSAIESEINQLPQFIIDMKIRL